MDPIYKSPPTSNVFCTDILDKILSFLPDKNNYGYNRKESIELWSRMAQVSQGFRWWVFCSEKGPFKLSEMKVISHIISSSPKLLRINFFIGVLDQEKNKKVDEAFQYIENPDHHPELHVISEISPYAKNYSGESLFDVVVSKTSNYHEKYEPILKMFFNKMSPSELLSKIPFFIDQKVFFHKPTKLIEMLFEAIKEKFGEISARLAFQPFLGNILCSYDSYFISIFYNWILEKGIEFNIESLSFCFSNDFPDWHEKKIFPLLRKIIHSQPEILEQTNLSGDRLIHILLKGQKTSFINEYLELILNKFPSEIRAKDHDGKSAISYIFENQNCIRKKEYAEQEPSYDYELFINFQTYSPSDLWEVREECFQIVLQNIKKERINILESPSTQTEAFLLCLSNFFDKEALEKWLYSPYGNAQECFMDQLAILSSPLIGQMIRQIDLNDKRINPIKQLANDENWNEGYWKGRRLDLAKMMFSKYPDLKASMYLQLFGQSIRHYPFDKNFTIMNRLFDSNWVNFIDSDGMTLLHYLFSIKKFEYDDSEIEPTIAYMMDRGFDPEVKNNAGETVVDLAIKNEWNDFLPLLQ